EKGILVPEAKDNITGYRYYTADQIAIAVKIKTLTGLGLTLEETSDFIEAENLGDRDAIKTLLRNHLARTREEITRLEHIAALLTNHRTEELIKMTLTEPIVKDIPAIRVMSKRGTGSYGPTIGRLIGELMQCLYSPENQRNFVKVVGPVMTIYHDEEYKEEHANVEVAVPVTGKITTTEGIEVRNLNATRVASLIHKGSYETISPAYPRLHEYVMKNKLQIIGPIMDIYLSDPNTTPKDEVMTEIQIPVK
ncbi:MAG: GyrI-like domain-containing protein, partial [Candidatus Bathyarchaeota archaeon]|nr:GyrI-like domain-containing protein [Candidatus Bathyarchaeota archaeon]